MSRRSCRRARQPVLRLVPLALALAVASAAVSGCSSSSDPRAAPEASSPGDVTGAAATSRPAVELQAALTAVLVERVHVVAAATDAIADAGGRLQAPAAEAARAALDGASTSLADVLGATYSEARAPVLEALRREDRLLAEHAAALTAGRDDEAARLRTELADAHVEAARVVRRVVPALDAEEVASRLAVDIDVQLARTSREPYAQLREASRDAAVTARLLAAGVVEDRGLGPVGTPAARLRTDVTRLLTEHVQLVGALAREAGRPGDGRADARAALSANAAELADVLGELYPAARAPFLRSWTAHLDRLETYAVSRAPGTGEPVAAATVLGYPAELARLLAEHVDGLPASSPETELERSLVSLLGAVDAASSTAGPAALRQATTDVLPAAALVAAAIAEHLRLA